MFRSKNQKSMQINHKHAIVLSAKRSFFKQDLIIIVFAVLPTMLLSLLINFVNCGTDEVYC